MVLPFKEPRIVGDNKQFSHIFNLMYDLPTFQRPSASLLIGVQA